MQGTLGSQMIKHRFGAQVITFLQSSFQHFLEWSSDGIKRNYTVGRYRTIGIRAGSRFNSFAAQTADKSMEKEVFGSIYIQFLSIGIRNISGNSNDIAIAEPVAGDFQLPGLRITAHPVIMNLIIIGSRRTNNLGQRVLLSRRDRYIHAAPIQHERGKIGLEGVRSIVPTPAGTPINRVRHGNIRRKGICHITDALTCQRIYQTVQILVHKFRIKTAYQIQTAFQRVIFYFSTITKTGIHGIIRSQLRQGGNRSDYLLNRSRPV